MSTVSPRRQAASAVILALIVAGGGFWVFRRVFPPPLPPLPETDRPFKLTLGPLTPDDWPQWLGPNRDGVSRETGLLPAWPAGGPELLWTFDGAGSGYSAPAVAGGVVFLPAARGEAEFLLALDAATGTKLGEAVIGRVLPQERQYGPGPRSTPAVAGTRVFALGSDGDLVGVDTATGGVWRRNIYRDFHGPQPRWGCGESPLVDGGHVVCTPGGPDGAVIALDQATGDPVWRSTGVTDEAQYGSLVPTDNGGVRQYVQSSLQTVYGVAAENGRLLWSAPRVGTNVVVTTPLVWDDNVYVTAGYGNGCSLLRVRAEDGAYAATQVYANKVMKNHHGGVVRVGGHVYGYSDERGWLCQEAATGREVWSEKRKLGKGCVTAADGKLYCLDEKDGTLCLVDAAPTGWREHGRLKLPRASASPRQSGKIWTHPVIANGRLYLRDQEFLFCYDIKGK